MLVRDAVERAAGMPLRTVSMQSSRSHVSHSCSVGVLPFFSCRPKRPFTNSCSLADTESAAARLSGSSSDFGATFRGSQNKRSGLRGLRFTNVSRRRISAGPVSDETMVSWKRQSTRSCGILLSDVWMVRPWLDRATRPGLWRERRNSPYRSGSCGRCFCGGYRHSAHATTAGEQGREG